MRLGGLVYSLSVMLLLGCALKSQSYTHLNALRGLSATPAPSAPPGPSAAPTPIVPPTPSPSSSPSPTVPPPLGTPAPTRSPDSFATPPPPLTTFPNFDAIGVDHSWWQIRPTNISFKAPFDTTTRIWIRRLIPNQLPDISHYRAELLSDQQPHRMALVAIAESNSTLMSQAKARYFELGRTQMIREYGQAGSSGSGVTFALATVYALDLIPWSSEAEFEAAFDIAEQTLKYSGKDAGKLPLFDNDFWATDPRRYKTLLAAVAFGRPGRSGQWANEKLANMSLPPESPDYVADPYMAANILSQIGLVGNEGFGRQPGGNGLGSYTAYYTQIMPILYGWDNAAGTKFIEQNYFLKTLGLQNVMNERTAILNVHDANATHLFSISSDPLAAWLNVQHGKFAGTQHFLFMKALMENKSVVAQAPTQKLVEANNGFWYAQEPANRDSFWAHIVARRLDHGRYPPTDGTFEMGIGKVALLRDRGYRGGTNGYLANGWFSTDPGVDLALPLENQRHTYWANGQRPAFPEDVVTNPAFVIRTLAQLPHHQLDAQGHLKFSLDYSNAWEGPTEQTSLHGDVKKAITDYDLDTANKTLVVTHTVQVNVANYFGYHFSPNLPTTATPDGFTFGDGVNSITVKLEPLDGTVLTRMISPGKNTDSPGRVAQNVGYTPNVRLPEHKVRITISVK